ncbi:MAG: hypothetical protein ACE14M_16660 [Terriglobales bacterium]
MRNIFAIVFVSMLIAPGTIHATSKPHVITFGRPITVKLFLGTTDDKSVNMRVRPLYVDGRLKEFTTGAPHDVTPSTFTVRQAYRVNDSLPDDPATVPRWRWQRGAWLLVDRSTGRVSGLKLPDFDTFYSAVSWYRDYAAYCGTSENGDKVYAVVAQLGRKKALVRKELGVTSGGDLPDSECAAPKWQRQPVRVTFFPRNAQKLTFDIRGRAAAVATEAEAE